MKGLARLTSGVEIADVALAKARARNTAEIDGRRSKLEFAQADLSRGTRLLAGTNFQVAQQDIVTAELNHSLAILDLARGPTLPHRLRMSARVQ